LYHLPGPKVFVGNHLPKVKTKSGKYFIIFPSRYLPVIHATGVKGIKLTKQKMGKQRKREKKVRVLLVVV
jgi:hypothetical protein